VIKQSIRFMYECEYKQEPHNSIEMNIPGDMVGLVCEYQTIQEAVRFLIALCGSGASFRVLQLKISPWCLKNLIDRLSTALCYKAATCKSMARVWDAARVTIMQRCMMCMSAITWKKPGWTTDEDLLCWMHYTEVHRTEIKTSAELAQLCGTSQVPAAIKRKYADLGYNRKKTRTRAQLYYITPLVSLIRQYQRQRSKS
jgi:hypothetical protein